MITSIESSKILIDSTWDNRGNRKMINLIQDFKNQLDEEIDISIGTACETMKKGYPQSLLTNFTADAMKKRAEKIWGNIDFAVINNGGLRSSINKGTITIANMYEVYSFDNTLVLIELQGKEVKRFFDYIAFSGGEGLSHGIHLEIKNKKIQSLYVGGNSIKNDKIYRIATLDYLAEGNGGMSVFRKAISLTNSNEYLRDIMIQYIKDLTYNNQSITAQMDDRIIIK